MRIGSCSFDTITTASSERDIEVAAIGDYQRFVNGEDHQLLRHPALIWARLSLKRRGSLFFRVSAPEVLGILDSILRRWVRAKS